MKVNVKMHIYQFGLGIELAKVLNAWWELHFYFGPVVFTVKFFSKEETWGHI